MQYEGTTKTKDLFYGFVVTAINEEKAINNRLTLLRGGASHLFHGFVEAKVRAHHPDAPHHRGGVHLTIKTKNVKYWKTEREKKRGKKVLHFKQLRVCCSTECPLRKYEANYQCFP